MLAYRRSINKYNWTDLKDNVEKWIFNYNQGFKAYFKQNSSVNILPLNTFLLCLESVIE